MKKIIVALLFGVLAACSSKPPKADIPATASPEDELGRFDEAIEDASVRNIDVLAASDFKQAVKWRDEAREDMSHARSQQEVLEDIRVGRGYLNRANSVPPSHEARASGLFEARRAAIQAGAAHFPGTRARLEKLDDQVSGEAPHLGELSIDRLTRIQQGYVALERDAVVNSQLSRAMSIIGGAKSEGAVRKAPRSYKSAQLAVAHAGSVIATNVRNPQAYNQAVVTANREADTLNEVMNLMRENRTIEEPAALRIVAQTHQISNMRGELNTAQGNLSAKANAEAALQQQNSQMSAELAAKNRDLSSTQQNLSSAQAAVQMQQALEKARTEFSSDEAETYQQGNNLVIRMKKINFPSGQADIPDSSKESLEKVTEIAKMLNASEVKVEGHTDSIGGAEINKEISEKRAEAVADYLKSAGITNVDAEGYGFEKPLASNKSKEGRAQNRRVDIVIVR
jgi:outer membrane protein OmpA-like peptidoglycan-associated protein